MQLGLLGPLIVRDGDGLELPPPAAAKERAVLTWLGLRCPQVASVSELLDALWGDDPPRTAAKTLQTYISALRRQLPPGSIKTSPGGYRLDVESDDIDINVFEGSVRDGVRALEAVEVLTVKAGWGPIPAVRSWSREWPES